MDIDTRSRSKTSPMTLHKAVDMYDKLVYKVYGAKPSIGRKEIMLAFHPDKMPAPLKTFMRNNKPFDKFVNHMFSELINRVTPVTREQFGNYLLKHGRDDLGI